MINQQTLLRRSCRHVHHRWRSHCQPHGLWRHAHHRQGIWGPPEIQARRARHPPPRHRARRQFNRHRRLLRPQRREELIAEALSIRTPPGSSSRPRADGSASAPASGPTTPARNISPGPRGAASSVCASTVSTSINSTIPDPAVSFDASMETLARTARSRARSATSRSPT